MSIIVAGYIGLAIICMLYDDEYWPSHISMQDTFTNNRMALKTDKTYLV